MRYANIPKSRSQGTLTKEIIINNLHSCINNVSNYKLTKEAFSHHTANFRSDVIDEIFKQVNIEKINEKVIRDKDFTNYLINSGLIGSVEKVSVSEALKFINEPADLRNRVAHGVNSEILNNNIIKQYAFFFKEYVSCIDRVLQEKLARFNLVNQFNLKNITDVYSKYNVVCLFNENKKNSVGDIILAVNSTDIRKCKILEIKKKDKNVKSVRENENIEVGIKTDVKIIKSHKLYIEQ